MINNRELIEPLLNFPHKDIFYFVQVLHRKKDHKGTVLGGSNNNSRLIKAYFITSLEKLDKQWEEMVKLAEVFEARVMINLNPRNFRKAGYHMLQKIANSMANDDFHNLHRVYTSVCGEYHSEIDKRWLIDLDSHQVLSAHGIKEFVKKEHLKLANHDKVTRYSVLGEIPSKSGIHIITNPFNLKEWKWPEIEIHKNNPVNLYIP